MIIVMRSQLGIPELLAVLGLSIVVFKPNWEACIKAGPRSMLFCRSVDHRPFCIGHRDPLKQSMPRRSLSGGGRYTGFAETDPGVGGVENSLAVGQPIHE
jgi:hypothetical protein